MENGTPVLRTLVSSPIKHPPERAIFHRLYKENGTKQTNCGIMHLKCTLCAVREGNHGCQLTKPVPTLHSAR